MTTSRKNVSRKSTAAAKTAKTAKKSARKAGKAAPGEKARRSALLAPILGAIRTLAGKDGQEDAGLFAKAFYHRLTEDELPLHTPDAWLRLPTISSTSRAGASRARPTCGCSTPR